MLADLKSDEAGRLMALQRLEILDTQDEQPFEKIINLVQLVLQVPMCAVSLIDAAGKDAEQNLPPFLADGLDQPDFVLAFAPKPMLMLSAIRDFFPIAGARQTFREGKQIYGLLSADESTISALRLSLRM